MTQPHEPLHGRALRLPPAADNLPVAVVPVDTQVRIRAFLDRLDLLGDGLVRLAPVELVHRPCRAADADRTGR